MGGAKLSEGRGLRRVRARSRLPRPASPPGLPAAAGACSRRSPADLPPISPVNMELRTTLAAVLCISAAGLQAACGAAPRRGPKVTEKVGADVALVRVKPSLHYLCLCSNGERARACTYVARVSETDARKGGRMDSKLFNTDLSRTHSTPPARTHARTLSCIRVHSDETAPQPPAVHALMRTPKGNLFMLQKKPGFPIPAGQKRETFLPQNKSE